MTDKNETGAMRIDADLVRQLAEMLDATQLTEIEVQDGDRKVRVARTAAAVAAPTHYQPAPAAAPAAPASEVAAPAPASHANAVKSPMVGTCYLAGEPSAPPFITVGKTRGGRRHAADRGGDEGDEPDPRPQCGRGEGDFGR